MPGQGSGRHRGHRILVVLPNTVVVEKLDVLRACGAEVVTTPGTLPREHPERVHNLARLIAVETPGGWFANRYDNPANPEIHYASTGPEIWAATDGRVTHLVAGIGTGGTISGTGRFLKEKGGVEVVGADPLTSRYGVGDGSPCFVEAAGQYLHTETVDDAWPLSYHQDVVGRIETVDDPRRAGPGGGGRTGHAGGRAGRAAPVRGGHGGDRRGGPRPARRRGGRLRGAPARRPPRRPAHPRGVGRPMRRRERQLAVVRCATRLLRCATRRGSV